MTKIGTVSQTIILLLDANRRRRWFGAHNIYYQYLYYYCYEIHTRARRTHERHGQRQCASNTGRQMTANHPSTRSGRRVCSAAAASAARAETSSVAAAAAAGILRVYHSTTTTATPPSRRRCTANRVVVRLPYR